MAMDDLGDALAREGLLPEPALDVVEHARMCRIGLVEDVLEREVRLPQPITEVLRKDPSTICSGHESENANTQPTRERTCIGGLLHRVVATRAFPGVEEGVVGKTVQERRFLHDLEDGMLNRGRVGTGEGVEVERDDRDPVRELLYSRVSAWRDPRDHTPLRTHRRISSQSRASRSGKGSRAR